MQYEDACQILECTMEVGTDRERLKRQYRKMCLKYHPDKNTDPSALQQFQDIQSAFEYLWKELDADDILDEEEEEINDVFQRAFTPSGDVHVNMDTFLHFLNTKFSFLDVSENPAIPTTEFIKQMISKGKEQSGFLLSWFIQCMSDTLQTKMLQWLDNMDKDTLLQLYEWLCKKQSDTTILSDKDSSNKIAIIVHHIRVLLQSSLKKRIQNDKYVILYPTLEDLFAANVYRHVENDHPYMIPTWMEESVFDLLTNEQEVDKDTELIVQCIPTCPEGVYLDQKHNVHKDVSLILSELWDLPDTHEIMVDIVGNLFVITKGELYMRKNQTITFPRRGVPCGNPHDIFDVSKRSNVVLHIGIGQRAFAAAQKPSLQQLNQKSALRSEPAKRVPSCCADSEDFGT